MTFIMHYTPWKDLPFGIVTHSGKLSKVLPLKVKIFQQRFLLGNLWYWCKNVFWITGTERLRVQGSWRKAGQEEKDTSLKTIFPYMLYVLVHLLLMLHRLKLRGVTRIFFFFWLVMNSSWRKSFQFILLVIFLFSNCAVKIKSGWL